MNNNASSVSARWQVFIAGCIMAVAALAAYHNCLRGPFLFDDVDSIPNNESIRHLWPLPGALSPPLGVTVSNRPVLNLSFALNYAFSGHATWSYHVLNLVIHILAGLALFGIVRRTLLQPVLRERFGEMALPAAFTVALLWLLHPLQTQSVTYIVQRAESLAGLFYLLTLYGFIRGAEEGASRRWFVLSFVACLLGMGVKESMATAPVMVFLYDRAFVGGTFREAWRRHKWFYAALVATWFMEWRLIFSLGKRDDTSGFGIGIPWWAYVRTQFHAVAHYLRMAVWPRPLLLYYEAGGWIDDPKWKGMGEVAPYAMLVIPLLAGTLLALRRWPAVGFLGAWFFVILAPTSLVPGSSETMTDRRMYLPLAAVIAFLVIGIYRWAGRRSLVLFIMLAVGLGFATERHNEIYRSEVSFWNDQVTKRPEDALAHYNLGVVLGRINESSEAIAQYREALRLQPDYPAAHNNLGSMLWKIPGHLPEAVAEYEAAVRLDPNYPDVHYNLGNALAKIPEKRADAIAEYKTAIRLRPDYAEAHNNLGVALADLPDHHAEAIAEYETAVRLKPDYAEAHYNLGIALATFTNRLPEAVTEFKEVLRSNPDYVEAYNNLGNALLKIHGRRTEAIAEYEAALRLSPDDVEAHFNLGAALLDTPGRRAEAVAQFQEALRLQPDLEIARQVLIQLKAAPAVAPH